MADNEKFKAAGAKIKNIFQFGRELCKNAYKYIYSIFDSGGKALYEMGISANTVTVAGFIIGLLAINFLAMNMFGYALLCILINVPVMRLTVQLPSMPERQISVSFWMLRWIICFMPGLSSGSRWQIRRKMPLQQSF